MKTVDQFRISEWQDLEGGKACSSMVRPDYMNGKGVTPFAGSTSVLRLRNVRTIGQRDRWWQNCSVGQTASLRYVCAAQAGGCC